MSVADWPQLPVSPPTTPVATAPTPERPFAPLPKLTAAQREAIAAEAQRTNERYLVEFVEAYGYCPFAKRGRRLGQVRRYVHFAAENSVDQLVQLMLTVARDPSQAVVQVVLPLIEVEPYAWHRFVSGITAFANEQLSREHRMGSAALHPALTYRDTSPFALIPLFRRAPSPTIQWVRLDVVRELYQGREGGTKVVALEDVDALLARPRMTPLYDRIAITNARMARRMRLDNVEQILAEYRDDARASFQRVLFDASLEAPSAADATTTEEGGR